MQSVILNERRKEVNASVRQTGNCAGCVRAGTCGGSGCRGCGGGTLYLTEGEITLLRRFGEIPFWPLARRADAEEPVCLEEEIYESAARDAVPVLLSALAQKGLIRLDFDLPLANFDYSAYSAYPHHGSMALTAAEYLLTHPEIKHGTIKIGFTPDEEIGCGVDFFDVEKFGADYAYTMDGGAVGELEYENFNAAGAKIRIQGCNIHPGSAKDKMVNAMLIGMELNGMLPVEQRPQFTTGYEGFFHLTGFNGTVEEATMSYIIRDHDMARFEQKKALLREVVTFINKKYGDVVALELRDQYYNMREQVEPHYHIIEKAVRAMEMAGVKPKIQPIRGGTDGARLSFMGLPCPNIFAGGVNFHGPYEFVSIQVMEKAMRVIVKICELTAAYHD